jgi:SOS-response transcriptional repressor LexA
LTADLLEENARLKEELRAANRETHPAVLVVPADVDPKEWLAEEGKVQAAADEYVAVPLLSGANAATAPENVLEADKDGWVLCPRSASKHPKTTFGFRVQDDAMTPAVPVGSLVGVDYTLRDPERVLKGGSGLVAVHDPRLGCTVRRIEKADQHWLFLPANPSGEYKSLVWAASEATESPITGAVLCAFVAY